MSSKAPRPAQRIPAFPAGYYAYQDPDDDRYQILEIVTHTGEDFVIAAGAPTPCALVPELYPGRFIPLHLQTRIHYPREQTAMPSVLIAYKCPKCQCRNAIEITATEANMESVSIRCGGDYCGFVLQLGEYRPQGNAYEARAI